MIVEACYCAECNCPVHYFFIVENELHTLCKKCGRIVTMVELQAELREKKLLEAKK